MAEDYLSAVVRDAVSAMETSPGAIDLDLSIDDFPLSTHIRVASTHQRSKQSGLMKFSDRRKIDKSPRLQMITDARQITAGSSSAGEDKATHDLPN